MVKVWLQPAENRHMDNNLDQWVTFYRVYHHGLRCWLLVQKRDGGTRTIAETAVYQAAWPELRRAA